MMIFIFLSLASPENVEEDGYFVCAMLHSQLLLLCTRSNLQQNQMLKRVWLLLTFSLAYSQISTYYQELPSMLFPENRKNSTNSGLN